MKHTVWLGIFVLATFTVSAQQQDESPRLAQPSQLRMISGHEARTSLGVSASFDTEREMNTAAGGRAGGTNGAKDAGGGGAATSTTLPLWGYQALAAQNGKSYSGL